MHSDPTQPHGLADNLRLILNLLFTYTERKPSPSISATAIPDRDDTLPCRRPGSCRARLSSALLPVRFCTDGALPISDMPNEHGLAVLCESRSLAASRPGGASPADKIHLSFPRCTVPLQVR